MYLPLKITNEKLLLYLTSVVSLYLQMCKCAVMELVSPSAGSLVDCRVLCQCPQSSELFVFGSYIDLYGLLFGMFSHGYTSVETSTEDPGELTFRVCQTTCSRVSQEAPICLHRETHPSM